MLSKSCYKLTVTEDLSDRRFCLRRSRYHPLLFKFLEKELIGSKLFSLLRACLLTRMIPLSKSMSSQIETRLLEVPEIQHVTKKVKEYAK